MGALIDSSVLVAADYTELAVRALHTAYGLDGSPSEARGASDGKSGGPAD